MAYYTGSVATPTALKALIESYCVTAGWSLASNWLSKGLSHVKLTAPDAEYLHIQGANSADGLTEPSALVEAIWINDTEWPVTYYIQINTSPNVVVCSLKHGIDRMMHIMFGDLVKVNTSAYVGGNFFFGSTTTDGGGISNWTSTPRAENCGLVVQGGDNIGITNTIFASGTNDNYKSIHRCIPFTQSIGYVAGYGLHAKIDGATWITSHNTVSYTDTTISALSRSPNTWNSQTHLIPMNLQIAMADSLYGYLGYIEHVRLVRIDNYEVGDIIEIAPDKWKVYPWIAKNTTYRNGGANACAYPGHTGTVGLAVRYDGP